VESPLQHRPHSTCPSHTSESEGTHPRTVANPLGTHSVMGEDSSAAASMINARSETAAAKPAFRDALRFRRCLIPADGFYEWVRTGKAKQPYCFEVDEGQLFAFAGLWDRWTRDGNTVETCSILTTIPNAVTSTVPRLHASRPRSRQLRPVA
jgi:putative SOS response-associated peptidase YedK